MRVFVTGAAGFIGTATVKELLNHGHQVLGLARSDASADVIAKAGAEPHRGDLEDIESLKSGAKTADAIIHLGFIHDFSNMAHSTAVDRAAIQAMAEAIAGSDKPLIISSGTLMVAKSALATEDDDIARNPGFDRWKSQDLIKSLSKEMNIRGMSVRFSPTVHGAGDKGFAKIFIDMTRKNGRAIYTGDGSARWPAVHRADAAVLLRLALEKGTAGGVYHAVAEQGIPVKDTMTLIGKRLGLPVEGMSPGEGAAFLGFFAHAMATDNPTSSEKTQKELGWQPNQVGLHEDMEANYFE
jgi:nucleoside-diphosphate-sugar epimerase